MTGKEIMAEEFERAGMRGYRADQVDAFLQKVADYVDEQDVKINDLTYKIQILADKIEEYKADEENIRDALLNAQKLGSSILNEAKAKAESLTRDAQAKAESMVNEAQSTSDELMEQAKTKVEALTKDSLQKANAELAAVKRERDAEQRHLEAMKQEVSKFRASILKQYKAHLDLLSSLPTVEESKTAEEKEAEEPEVIQAPEEVIEPAAEEPAEEKIEEIPAEETAAAVEEGDSASEAEPEKIETITSELSGVEQELENEEKAQTKEFVGESKSEEKSRESERHEYAFNRRSTRNSYVEKFGELRFGGFNDKDKK